MKMENKRRQLLGRAIKFALTSRTLVSSITLSGALVACGSADEKTNPSKRKIEISLNSSSSAALTAFTLNTSGVDYLNDYSVIATYSSGAVQILSPIRATESAGIVLPTPIIIDAITGKSSHGSITIKVAQGSVTSNEVTLGIVDIPSLETMGVKPGEISSALLTFHAISFGQTLNRLEVINSFSTNKVDTSLARADIKQLMLESARLRESIESYLTGKNPVLALGSTADGLEIQFDANSLDLLDRVIAVYLSAIGYFPNLSTLASTAAPSMKFKVAFEETSSATSLLLTDHLSSFLTALKKIPDPDFITTPLIVASAGQSLFGDESHRDNVIAAASAIAGAVAIVATVLSAPAVGTAAAIVGLGLGAYVVARDLHAIFLEEDVDYRYEVPKLVIDVFSLIPGVRAARPLVKSVTGVLGSMAGGVALAFGLPPEASMKPATEAYFERRKNGQSTAWISGNIANQPEEKLQSVNVFDSSGGTIARAPSDPAGNFRVIVPVSPALNTPTQIAIDDLLDGKRTSRLASLGITSIKPNASIKSPIIVYSESGGPSSGGSLLVSGDALKIGNSNFTPDPSKTTVNTFGPLCTYKSEDGSIAFCRSDFALLFSSDPASVSIYGALILSTLAISQIVTTESPIAPGTDPFSISVRYSVVRTTVSPMETATADYTLICGTDLSCSAMHVAGVELDVASRTITFRNALLTSEDGALTVLNGTLLY